jgi:anti-sigma factor RsiW
MELNGHAPEEMLEEYSRGRLPEAEAECLEEHLLVCPQCQDQLAEVDAFVDAARQAAARLQMEPQARNWRALWQWLARPAPLAMATGVAILLAGAVVVWRTGPRNEPVVSVYLQAVRGGEGLLNAHAPVDKRLRLRLDPAGLPALGSYRLQIVDTRGTGVFEAEARRDAGEISAQVTTRLAAGRYWVRLYEPRSPGPLLREFGLAIE